MVWGNAQGDCIVEDLQNGWHLQAWYELLDGVPRIIELRIRSAAGASTLRGARGPRGARQDYTHELGRKVPGNGIDSNVLRLGLQRLHDAVENDATARAMLTLRGIALDASFRAARHPGRKGRSDFFYAVWCARYVEMCATTSRPYPALAEKYPGYSASTIQRFVDEAHKRKLLVDRTKGRAGGRLSARAKKLLEKGDAQ